MRTILLALCLASGLTNTIALGGDDPDQPRTRATQDVASCIDPGVIPPGQYPNYRMNQDASCLKQLEAQIAISPVNTNNMAATWQDYSTNTERIAYGYSTDGGITWSGNVIPDHIGGFDRESDPVIAVDGNGWFYLVFISGTNEQTGGTYLLRSSDGGATFPISSLQRLDQDPPGNDLFEDGPRIAVDRNTSPNRIYVAWAHFPGSTILLARSTNGGTSFEPPVTVSDVSRPGQWGAVPVIDSHGYVDIIWTAQPSGSTQKLYFDQSTNGGALFGPDHIITDPVEAVALGIKGLDRVILLPSVVINPASGYLYVTWTNRVAGDQTLDSCDVLFIRSTDDGATWSGPINIMTNGANPSVTLNDQFFPSVIVNPAGNRVSIGFYDRSDFPNNDSTYYKVVTSIDGGKSFTSPVTISNYRSYPKYHSLFFGDYYFIAPSPDPTTPGKIYPIWADTRYGNADMFISPADVQVKLKGVLQYPSTLSGRVFVEDNLTIASGVTLTITPGTQITVSPGKTITVNGSLVANGTQAQPIVFTSNSATPVPGSWSGIRLYGGPNTLSYCTIKYAVDGITVNSNAGTTLQNDSIKQCDNAGVNEVNAPGYGALSVQSSYLQNNFYGLVNHNGWAEVKSSTVISNNGFDGIDMYHGAYMYIDHTSIQNNACFGIYADGSAIAAYLAAGGTGGGYNTVTGNGCGQIYLDSSASVFIGDKYQTCDCIEAPIGIDLGKKKYDPSVRAVSSQGCNPPCTLNWHQQGGYNTINGTYYWVDNRTTSGVYADLTCWGTTSPPTSAFNGTVYRDYPLTTGCSGGLATPSIVRTSNGDTEMAGSADENLLNQTDVPTLQDASQDVKVVVRHALSLIQDNPDSAEYAIPMLMGFVGPIGTYANLLASPWDSLLQDVERNSPSNLLRMQATVYKIQTYQVRGEYARAIALAQALLSRIPNDELWLYCQEQIIFANVSQGDLNTAANIFSSMQAQGIRISPRAMTHLGKFLLMKGANVSLTGAAGLIKAGLYSSGAPTSYRLLQNYPNPFNPTTEFDYALPEDGHVMLKVFNVLGQEIATVVDAFQSAGYKSISFDASKLPSGLYFYRLQAGKFTDTKKMMLVK